MQQGRDHVRDVRKGRRLPRRSPVRRTADAAYRAAFELAAPLGLAGRSPRLLVEFRDQGPLLLPLRFGHPRALRIVLIGVGHTKRISHT